MPITDTDEYIDYSSFNNDGGITTGDTFNTWRKKTNGIINAIDGISITNIEPSQLSLGAPTWTTAGALSTYNDGAGTFRASSIIGTSLSTGGGAITGGTITGTSLSTGGGAITGGTITGTSLSTGGGAITGGTVTASAFSGPLTGNVTGNVTGGVIKGTSLIISNVSNAQALPTLNSSGTNEITPSVQQVGTNENTSSIGLFNSNSSPTSDAHLVFNKSLAGAAVTNGTHLGGLGFHGSGGTSFKGAASIRALVDGSVTANSVPGRLIFQTTAVGASTPAIRMVIKNNGNVGIGTTNPTSALQVNGAVTGTSFNGPLNGNATSANTVANGSVTAAKLDGGQSGPAPVFGIRAYAYINSNGTINVNNGFSSASRSARGVYTLTLTRNPTSKPIIVATCYNSNSNFSAAIYDMSSNFKTFKVRTGYEDGENTTHDTDFNIMVLY